MRLINTLHMANAARCTLFLLPSCCTERVVKHGEMAEAKFRCIKLANNLARGNGKKFISCQPSDQPAVSSSLYPYSSLIRRVVCPVGFGDTLAMGRWVLIYLINLGFG